MRSSRSTFALAVATLVLTATAAHAQFRGLGSSGGGSSRSIVFGAGGGVAVPVSDAKDAFKTGWNGIAYARYQPRSLPVSFGVNVSFQRFDFKDAVVTSIGPGASGNGQLLAGAGDVKVDLVHGPIRPYVLAGLGAYNFKTDVSGAPAGYAAAGSKSSTRFGINGGAGVAARVGAVSAFVQGRVDNVFTEKGVIDTKTVQVIPVTFGVEF